MKPETAVVRLSVAVLEQVDAWTSSQPDPKPSRPEAIRKLLQKALEAENEDQFGGVGG